MTAQLFIDGTWQTASCATRLPVFNPSNGEQIASVACASEADVELAVQAAQRALPAWSQRPASERAAYLRAFAAQIEARGPQLIELQMRNSGKPRHEAELDIADAIATFVYYADLADGLDARQNAAVALPDSSYQAFTRLEPLGVVGLIVPWNFPLVTSAWKLAPALAAGCCVVLKPSELTPLIELQLGEIASAIGLPAGVFNLLPGDAATGAALVAHPQIAKLSFTGSNAVGRKVMQAASARTLPVALELGGKSPILVFADSDLEQAVQWIIAGICWNAGQMCSATSRLLVEESIADALLDRLASALAALKVGDPHSEGCEMGPMTSQAQLHKVLEYFAIAEREGLQCLGGARQLPGPGWFVAPTLYADVPQDSRLWREEIFGPVLCTRRFKDEADALQQANACDFALAATVVSADRNRALRVAAALEAGHVWINSAQVIYPHTSWGGGKASGIGRELGPWGLSAFQQVKHITVPHADS
ncbi:aldehyde dehydrogenase family protein [Aquipseudomonas guryensis]|uniref:Aldehyde dehydrogenase family protein n=1 Tax=Aquipseudomonas guryensis TaxID=2759165 RepID=A0A7W4H2Q3_9GAMM|nr:aldehyde dehydrogenase family protein [Pseudomonas guryensis]MBB1518725.1 aldehyde dehydrogenase family protein [Pseudomonas guryensis]